MSDDELVSVIIPSRNERFLLPTVESLFKNATGPIEIIVVLDGGAWPQPEPLPSEVITIRHAEPQGTRRSINDGVAVSSGKYILKSDGHCLFDVGFDEKLKASCFPEHVVIPRRKRLDAENWCTQDVGKPDIDYEYISWHPTDFGGWQHNIKRWDARNADLRLRDTLIDDMMCFQASSYFMRREYFDYLELMDEQTYGKLMNEGEEIAFKCWLSGGRVIVNKKTWYAHLRKGKRYGRGYEMDTAEVKKGAFGVRRWLTNSAWNEKQVLPFDWLIDKFNPPGWPENWRELINQ